MTQKLEVFVEELRRMFSDALVELDCFPSQTVMIDVVLNNRFFVLEYLPREGFGISEIRNSAEGWLGGHENTFTRFEDARDCLISLVASAEKTRKESHLAAA